MTHLKQLVERFNASLQRAADAGLYLPNGGSLATVGSDGQPSVRVVLLKNADENGFVFYTNLGSRKSGELRMNPRASICFWWPGLEEQVRVEGIVTPVEDAEADAYWKTRPRGSQLGALASRQSEPLASRSDLENRYAELEAEYADKEIPRPDFWSGYRLRPDRIEFWKGREDRLHVRELFTRKGDDWKRQYLNP
jgi:pyridoxamine 5'-phosphate oxidase